MGLFSRKKSSSKKSRDEVPSDTEYENNTDYDSPLWDSDQWPEKIWLTMTEEMMDRVKELKLSGKPMEFDDYVRALKNEFPDREVSRRYLRTVVQRTERDYFGEFNDKDRLLKVIEKQGYISTRKPFENTKLESIFFTHPRSLNMLRLYPWLLFVDHMFAIDRCDWILVSISGHSPCKKTFFVGFAFIPRSTVAELSWVLQEFQQVLRDQKIREPGVVMIDGSKMLLDACKASFKNSAFVTDRLFHGKDVLAHVQLTSNKKLGLQFMLKWHAICSATDEKTFIDKLQKFVNKYGGKWPEETAYATAFFRTDANCVVSYWAEQRLHLNTLMSYPIETIYDDIGKNRSHDETLSGTFLDLDKLNHDRIDEIMAEHLKHINGTADHDYFTEAEHNVPPESWLRWGDQESLINNMPPPKVLHPAWRFKAPHDIVDFKRTDISA